MNQDLIKRLRIKSMMIAAGERIQWGSDSAIMDEAADALETAYADGYKQGRFDAEMDTTVHNSPTQAD